MASSFYLKVNLIEAVEKSQTDLLKKIVSSMIITSHPQWQSDNGYEFLRALVRKNLSALTEVILLKNPDVNSFEDLDNPTPLQIAVKNQNLIIVRLLIQNGADVNPKARESANPPLAIAYKSLYLLEKEKEVYQRLKVESQSLPFSAEIISGVMKRRCFINDRLFENAQEIFELLLRHGASVNVKYGGKKNLLIDAVRYRDTIFIKMILENYRPDFNVTFEKNCWLFDVILSEKYLNKISKEVSYNLYEFKFNINEVVKIFVRHIVKLESMKALKLSEGNERAISMIDKIVFYRNKCREEVSKMKNDYFYVNPDLCVYSILVSNLSLVESVSSEVMEEVKSKEFKFEYPIYANDLIERLLLII
ncbi:uncharacterized protein LOC141527921 [Cotesia typhae]|uniref:uncharacterized protein LOC141527921 n=1 Tax=Cotesia typhae TaxID=2053667 RepID=UPI003D68F9B3